MRFFLFEFESIIAFMFGTMTIIPIVAIMMWAGNIDVSIEKPYYAEAAACEKKLDTCTTDMAQLRELKRDNSTVWPLALAFIVATVAAFYFERQAREARAEAAELRKLFHHVQGELHVYREKDRKKKRAKR